MRRSWGRAGVRRWTWTVSALVAGATLTACGSSAGTGGEDAAASTPSKAATPATGACGGGATNVVKAAHGVQLTVPASWRVRSAAGGSKVGLYPPDPDSGDGYLVVRRTNQTLDEAVQEVLASTGDAAEKTSQRDLRLTGLAGARLTISRYDDADHTYAVDVVAVGGGLRVVADMTRSGDAEEQAVVESCLSSLTRRAGR